MLCMYVYLYPTHLKPQQYICTYNANIPTNAGFQCVIFTICLIDQILLYDTGLSVYCLYCGCDCSAMYCVFNCLVCLVFFFKYIFTGHYPGYNLRNEQTVCNATNVIK